MKPVPDNYLAQFSPIGGPPDAAFGGALLDKIGDDLRHVYGDLTESEPPRSLLDLAEAIDARRMSEMDDR